MTNRTTDRRVIIVCVVALVALCGYFITISYWTSTAKATAAQLFVQMQNEDVAGTLRGQPAQDMADQIEKTLKHRDLYLDAINLKSGTLEIFVQRAWERDAWETLIKLRNTHNDPDSALRLATTFDRYQRRSGKHLEDFFVSQQDIDDKQVFRNRVEKAIADKVHVSATDCVRAGIVMPTKTVIQRVAAKPKPPAAKKPVAKKAAARPANRTAFRTR